MNELRELEAKDQVSGRRHRAVGGVGGVACSGHEAGGDGKGDKREEEGKRRRESGGGGRRAFRDRCLSRPGPRSSRRARGRREMSLQRPLPQGSKFGLPRFVPHTPFLPARLCVCASFAEQSETDVLVAHLARQANERHSADDTERGCDSAGENPLAVQCPARPSPPPPLPPALPPPLSLLWLTLPPPTHPPASSFPDGLQARPQIDREASS